MTAARTPAGGPGLAPAPRWVAPIFALLGAATVPWTAYLAMTLPGQARTHHYRLAWVGFDVLLILVLLATATAAWRGRQVVGLLAACAATMLVVDAWFDVMTSRGSDVPQAIVTAVLIELPLAAVCGWIALHVDQVVAQRLRLLSWRAVWLQALAMRLGRADATELRDACEADAAVLANAAALANAADLADVAELREACEADAADLSARSRPKQAPLSDASEAERQAHIRN